MARDLKALIVTQDMTRDDIAAGIRVGAMVTAHRELAQVLAAMETERRLPAYLLPSLRRIETMLRADTIAEIADRAWTRTHAEACP